MTGPLAGLRVVELAGNGPAPFGVMVLADLGADVLRIDRPTAVGTHAPDRPTSFSHDNLAVNLLFRGRRSAAVDLKDKEGIELLLRLVERADVLVEPYRPGVMERLGLGPDVCLVRNPALVYARMTGWGQDGPLAHKPGHDVDYIALAGALSLIGRADDGPVPPPAMLGDFGGGGMLLAVGVLAALHERMRSGRGQVVDAAVVDGTSLLTTIFHGARAVGYWSDARGSNTTDTGAPFYDVYETADGEHVAVSAMEPPFWRELLRITGLDPAALPPQMDRAQWPVLRRRLADVFRTRTRDEWCALADGPDACLAPVLSLAEAPSHPHAIARRSFVDVEGFVQPAPAPRFDRSAPDVPTRPPRPGEHTSAALADWGIASEDIERLRGGGVVA